MNWQQLSKAGLELPEVEEGIWFRTPALKVRGKSFVRLKEDGETVRLRSAWQLKAPKTLAHSLRSR